MSERITQELRDAMNVEREYAMGGDVVTRTYCMGRDEFANLCDNIDAVHANLERENEELRGRGDGFVRLPKDADGEYIHIGDKVTCARSVWQVTGLRLTGLAWGVCCTIFNDHGGSGTNVYPPCDLHHYHAPTVEDVLREMADRCYADEDEPRDRDAIVAEYAPKLRLAGDAE